ncbi:MAG: phage tail protein [Firmicutes bacterium HGW-Firmicutes-16]|nr:MAG: phage tail protein [Firmicutes bacterium HGW-Firmicutes-16]
MRNANQSFDKDLSGLQRKLDAFNRTKISLKVDVSKAQSELKAAEKQFIKTGDAADKLKLEMANQNYENANRNLKLVSSNARQAEKDMASLTTTVSKSENRAGSASGNSGILNTLGAAGASAFLGNALSQVANTYVASAYGEETGTVFSSTLSGAGMGAAIGSVIPGIGTAVGAAVGGLVGAIQGLSAVQQKKDDAFKDYYKNLYDTVTGEQADSLTNGSSLAANRETTKLSFKTLLGSDSASSEYVDELKTMAAKTPFEFGDLTSIGKTLLAYHYSADDSLKTMNAVGEAGSALGLDASSMKDMAAYLGRMNVTGKTTMEYLNPLMERGVDVYTALSKLPGVTGKTNEQIQDMVTKGLIPGAEAAKAISDYMATTYSGSMEAQSKTFSGLQSTLSDTKAEIDNSMGEGYNETRKTGMQNEIDYYSGDNGVEMQDAYKKIGQYKASLENNKEQLERDALSSVMSGTIADSYSGSDHLSALQEAANDYKLAQANFYDANKNDNTAGVEEAGAAMGEALARAKAIAQNEYDGSEGAQIANESAISLANSICQDSSVNDSWKNAGYSLAQAFTKGLKSGLTTGTYTVTINGDEGAAENWLENSRFAYGLSYVPYDNYPAMLHEGERVLTASEARGYGNAAVVKISGNSFVIREEADIDKVASALVAKIRRAQLLAVE